VLAPQKPNSEISKMAQDIIKKIMNEISAVNKININPERLLHNELEYSDGEFYICGHVRFE